ncbi:MAG TPA: chromosome segregation protein SMC [Candidatus Acidoferrales bacterium]|nr:chromosome segregation protein SMC [Candidatus Acidoferrales bacterium]
MFLSKLELFGFKSFATKTELTFNGGITSVVGPNGCGKTNVLDSIRWVLGEQRTSMLRSDSMENVIFNGSENRKALGMAEVTITLKNDKGLLPVDYSEVSITRRVFRSGEGEYFVNRNQCRLKDIQDMLMDSGMAPTAYSVIELKMVEDILRENADERRKMFEEASGVTKYKARRKAALGKLDDVRRDLLRVNDLIAEIEKKVNSLERQAKKAEHYKQFMDELNLLERQYLFAEYSSVLSKIAPLRESLSVSETEKANSLDALSHQEEILKLIRSEIDDCEKSLSILRQQRATKQTDLHAVDEEVAVLSERKRGLNENVSSLDKRKIDLAAKNESLLSQMNELELSLDESIEEEKELSVSLATEQEDFRNSEQQLFSAREKSNASHDDLIQILNGLAVKQNERERCHARLERLQSHNEELAIRMNQLETEKDELSSRVEGSRAEKQKIIDGIESEKKNLTDFERHREELFSEVEREKQRAQKLRDRQQANDARADFLNGLVEHLEGVPDGAKALARGEVAGLPKFEILSDIFYVEPDYRIAAESILGEASNFLVAPDEHAALSAVDALRKRDLGKVTFICRDKIVSPAPRPNPAAQRRLMDHVSTSTENIQIGKYFFENVAVVENFSEAEKILQEDGSVTCVNFSGDVFSSKGIIRGGSTRKTEGGRVGKLKQLEELKSESQKLSGELSGVEREIAALQSQIDGIPIKTGNDTLRNLELQLARVEQSNVESERSLQNVETQIVDMHARVMKLGTEISDADAELAKVEAALSEVSLRKSSSEDDYQKTLEAVKTIEDAYRQKNDILREVQAQHIECVNKLNFLKREIETSRQQVATNLEGISRADEDIETAKLAIEQAGKKLSEHEDRRVNLRSEIDALDAQTNGLMVKLSSKKDESEVEEKELRDARANHETAIEAVHQVTLKIGELDAHADAILERAKEEYNLDVSQQTAESMNLSAGFDAGAAHERINYLKGRIESFGPVNLVAFSEYTEEKQRLDFLTAQRGDLLEAEKTLKETVEEINRTAHQKFKDTFDQISENFKVTFQSLFDGGEAELRLEENVDPLEAKIEIMAKPAGKKPQSIDLLSAGEKTLTAIALLFSIYLVKPSPFCILDEVDGPLDDNNTDNFVRMIKRFSGDTQFIVITHNKRTMEAADTLYGVTMEEQGVSKVVAVRFVDDWVAKE